MDLSKLLTPGAVRVLGQMTSKKRLFQELGEIAASAYGLTAATAIDGLQERESLGPTGVGNGIAIPHGKLKELSQITGLFARLETPVDFEALDDQPVDLVFLLLAPEGAGEGTEDGCRLRIADGSARVDRRRRTDDSVSIPRAPGKPCRHLRPDRPERRSAGIVQDHAVVGDVELAGDVDAQL